MKVARFFGNHCSSINHCIQPLQHRNSLTQTIVTTLVLFLYFSLYKLCLKAIWDCVALSCLLKRSALGRDASTTPYVRKERPSETRACLHILPPWSEISRSFKYKYKQQTIFTFPSILVYVSPASRPRCGTSAASALLRF